MARTTMPWFIIAAFMLTAAVSALQFVPEVTMSLDDAPEHRWIPAIDAVVHAHGINNSICAVLNFYIPVLGILPADTGSILAATIKARYPTRYAELQGICDRVTKLGCPVQIDTLAPFFYFYELMHINAFQEAYHQAAAGTASGHRHLHRQRPTAAASWRRSCSGILSLPVDRSQPIIHGRNMDESPHQGRNMTLRINVTKGGKLLYQIADWTWITTGFFTSQRFGGVSLEQNWREADSFTYQEVMANIANPKSNPFVTMYRAIQEGEMDFDAAVSFLTDANNMAPFYVIMSGTKRRGAILSIDANASLTHREFLHDGMNVTFKVQTNYDRWLPDPADDDRRTVAENTLSMMGRPRSGTELGVWMALSTFPVHNPTTMFTALLGAERPVAEVYVRQAMDLHP